MTSPKFDLATELLKGGLPRMAQAIASLYEWHNIPYARFSSAEDWLASLSAATPPANVEQPAHDVTCGACGVRFTGWDHTCKQKDSLHQPAIALAELRQVEGATGANAERLPNRCSRCNMPNGDGVLYYCGVLGDGVPPLCGTCTNCELLDARAKLSTSEARARELDGALSRQAQSFSRVLSEPDYRPLFANADAAAFISSALRIQSQLSATQAQLLAEQARARGLENALSAMTDRKRMLDQREASLLDDVREAGRKIARLENELAWEKAWDLHRKHAMGAVVEAARGFFAASLGTEEERKAYRVLRERLCALDASSKPDAHAMVLGGFGAPGYGMQPAPIAEPEPAERPIVVGSIVKHLPSGQIRKVARYSSDPLSSRPFVFEHPIQSGLYEVRSAGASELELVSDPVPSEPSK